MRARTNRPLAPLRARRRLAVGYAVAVTAIAATELLPGGGWRFLQVAGLLGAFTLGVLLRRATRLVVDAPEDALDEMLVRLRDHAFVDAYRGLAAVTVAVAAVLLVGATRLPGPALFAMAWISLGAALGLPLVVAAVTLPDAEDANDTGPVPA